MSVRNSSRRSCYSPQPVMRFQVLFVTVFALLTCSNAISVTDRPLSDPSYSTFNTQRRSLRTDKAADEVDKSMEERNVVKWVKVRIWLETGKTDEFVLTKLKLNGMDDATMKIQKNYKYYEFFAEKSLEYRINRWLREDTTTWNVWKKLGFTDITERGQLKNIVNTPNFKIFERYVNDFDDMIQRRVRRGITVPAVMIERGATDVEIYVRTVIMAKAGREDDYAKILLGLTLPNYPSVSLKGDALRKHEGYNLFETFQELKNKIAEAAKAANTAS